jgi:DNA-binding transcriptional regulator YiaG
MKVISEVKFVPAADKTKEESDSLDVEKACTETKQQKNTYIYPTPKTYTYNGCVKPGNKYAKDNGQNAERSSKSPQTKNAAKRRYNKGEVSQTIAAKLCHVSCRTIQNWEKNIRKPQGYPGRAHKDALLIWAQGYSDHNGYLAEAREMNRATAMDPAKLDGMDPAIPDRIAEESGLD